MKYEDNDAKMGKNTEKNGGMAADISESERGDANVVYLLPCDIVRDLLPSYAEGLTSEMTARSIENHLKSCAACSEALAAMQSDDRSVICAISADADVPPGDNTSPKGETKEIDYLKKVRRRFITGIVICVIAALAFLCFFWAFQFRFYSYDMSMSNVNCSVHVEDNVVEFGGAAKEEYAAVGDIKFDYDDGVVSITGEMRRKMPWNRSDFREKFTAYKYVKQVWVGDELVWENGKTVPEDVRKLYSVKNPYVGDVMADGMVMLTLRIQSDFGIYSTELQTTTQPYGWTIKFEDPIDAGGKDLDKQLDLLRRDSYMMIALIDNLGYMKWEYRTLESDELKTLTVTKEEATQALGSDIKKCAENTETLRAAMEKFDIS